MEHATLKRQATAFSGALHATSAFGNVYLFAGRRFDDPTGLYYNRHRYYEPRSGRFLSRDPLGYGDGLNLYGYVQNAPPNRIDPLGQRWLPIARKYQKKSEMFVSYVNKLKDAAGRTEVYYGIWLTCYCFKRGRKRGWYMRARFGLVYEIKLEKKLLKDTADRLHGIYGHELKHAQSIDEAVQRNMPGLAGLFRRFENGSTGAGYYSQHACEAQKKYAYQQVERELLKIIKAGAGHDTDPNTTKPGESELINPANGQEPGTVKEAKKKRKEVQERTRGKTYKKYVPQ